MPRPRNPLARAIATGAAVKHPERYRPLPPAHGFALEPLGDPPGWLKAPAVECWEEMRLGMPWLDQSHRGIVAIAALLWARWQAGEESTKVGNLLRLCLQQMGATPATEHIARRSVLDFACTDGSHPDRRTPRGDAGC